MATKMKKYQDGGKIEGYKATTKSRNTLGGGKVIKSKETFINNSKGYDNMQTDKKTRVKQDKNGEFVRAKVKETSRPTASSKSNIKFTRVTKTSPNGKTDVDRSGIAPVKKGIAYRKTGGASKTSKK